jgi:hypothetical protein
VVVVAVLQHQEQQELLVQDMFTLPVLQWQQLLVLQVLTLQQEHSHSSTNTVEAVVVVPE